MRLYRISSDHSLGEKSGLVKLIKRYLIVFQVSPLVKNIGKVYGGDILSKASAVGTLLLLVRELSVGEFAFYIAFSTIRSLTPALACGGINMALIRFSAEYMSKESEKPVKLYFLAFIFEVVLFALFSVSLLFISAKISSILFGGAEYVAPFRYGLLAGVGFLLVEAGRSVYQAEERFNLYVLSLWIRQALIFLFVVSLSLTKKLSFSNTALAISIVDLMVGATVAYDVLREARPRDAFAFMHRELGLVKDFFSSTKWLIGYLFALATLSRLNVFMLSHLSTEEELANYGVAYRYYSLVLLLLGSIHAVLRPKFSRVEMQDVERQRSFTLRWLRYTIWLFFPLAIADLIGKPVFTWLNGGQYEKAFYVFVVFSVGIWFSLMFSPLSNVLMSRKKFRFLFFLALVGLAANFTSNYLAIPLWGGYGAALVTVLSYNIVIQGLSLTQILRR